MGLFDFLKVDTVEKKKVPKYTATVTIDGKAYSVANLGMESVTLSGAGKFKQGQTVAFALSLKDPKENLSIRGSGPVMAVIKGEAKVGFGGLSPEHKQSVARFLARYMMAR